MTVCGETCKASAVSSTSSRRTTAKPARLRRASGRCVRGRNPPELATDSGPPLVQRRTSGGRAQWPRSKPSGELSGTMAVVNGGVMPNSLPARSGKEPLAHHVTSKTRASKRTRKAKLQSRPTGATTNPLSLWKQPSLSNSALRRRKLCYGPAAHRHGVGITAIRYFPPLVLRCCSGGSLSRENLVHGRWNGV